MAPKASVLLVDDEQNILKTVKICLETVGFEVAAFSGPLEALEALRNGFFAMAFYDLKMEPIDGIQLLEETRKLSPDTVVVIMTAHGSVDSAVHAMKKGAFDYLQKPFEFSELQHFAERVYEHYRLRNEVRLLREELEKKKGELVMRSDQMRGIVDLALKVAPSAMSVVIEGESGTGKELLARLIHENSPRAARQFVPVNCAALPETLLESELFGHVRGAFTGATKDRQGRFEVADGGTVFLDEIGEIPAPTQVKLLRFLQSKEFERVGESVTRRVDVRVIAATNRDLDEALRSGSVREDLYYRLNAMRLRIPPLRERTEDIPLLVQHFLKQFGSSSEVSREVVSALAGYRWKGNVRELQNVIERAVLLSGNTPIQLHHLPDEFQAISAGHENLSLEELERQHIIKVMRIARDYDEAASLLGINPATLWRKRKKFKL